MTIKEVHEQNPDYTILYIREWIVSGRCPFGSWVQFPGSSRRTFKINVAAYERWKKGETA